MPEEDIISSQMAAEMSLRDTMMVRKSLLHMLRYNPASILDKSEVAQEQ